MTSLVDIIEQLIKEEWMLERSGSAWVVREENITNNPELRIAGARAVGFSLDRGNGMDPWPFMAALSGMRRVCDAIIVTHVEDTHYVIAIEMKSGNIGQATRQVVSAWHFMEWLRALLRENKHWAGGWKFCGLISSVPRRRERKGTTRRRLEYEISSLPNHPFSVAHIKNKRRIDLQGFHRVMAVHE